MANKEGTGAIFSNKKKSAASPDFNGFIVLNGEKIDFSCWWQTSSKGERYLSVSKTKVKKAEAVEEPKTEQPKEVEPSLFDCPDFEEDFCPF